MIPLTLEIIRFLLKEAYNELQEEIKGFEHEKRPYGNTYTDCLHNTELWDVEEPIIAKFKENGYDFKLVSSMSASFNPIVFYECQGYKIRMEEKCQRYQTFIEIMSHY